MTTLQTKIDTFDANYVESSPTLADVSAITTLINICTQHVSGVSEVHEQSIRADLTMPGVDPATDFLTIRAPDGEMVGYAEIWDYLPPHVNVGLWWCVHPAYQDRGVEGRLLSFALRRARQAVKKAPPEARVYVRSWCNQKDANTNRYLREHQFELIRHSLRMAIEFDEPPAQPVVPDGIIIRPMTADQFDDVIRADREAFADHWGYVPRPFEEERQIWLHWTESDPRHDPSLWFVAMARDEIAGISLCESAHDSDPDMGWVSTLGVRRAWRRRGLGLALLQYSFCELHGRGSKRAGLGVDASSLTGATRLYHKAGMRTVRTSNVYERELRPGKELAKVAL